jgi:hypothetical protein
VLAFELSGCFRLAIQPGERLRVGTEFAPKELHGDRLVEFQVGRRDDDTHPALGDDAFDPKFTADHGSDAHPRWQTGSSRDGGYLHNQSIYRVCPANTSAEGVLRTVCVGDNGPWRTL